MAEDFKYDVFLSHNKADKARIRRLAERLRAEGLHIWFDEWIIKPGDDIYLAIERGLEISRTLVLCLSPAALGSDWVGLERSTVLFRDPSNAGRRFIPLLLADCKLPDTLRRYKYVDYRGEKQAAFDQVLACCRPQKQVESVSVVLKATDRPSSIVTGEQEEEWERADNGVRKKLPLGVKLVRTLRGHTSWIGRIAWSSDGKILASPSNDETIRLWDIETGKCLHTLIGHEESVMSVAFKPTGCTLASGSNDRTVKMWDTNTGKLLRTLKGHDSGVYSVAFTMRGHTLSSAGLDEIINIWDINNGGIIQSLKGHSEPINSLAYDSHSGLLASGSDDETVRLWKDKHLDVKLVNEFKCHSHDVTDVAFNPQGGTMATAGWDMAINLLEVSTGRLLRTFEGHVGQVNCVAFLANGRMIASKGDHTDNTVRLWNTESGNCVAVIPEPSSYIWFPGLAFHPYLPLLAAVGSDSFEPREDRDCIIHIYELDINVLLGQVTEPSVHYINAKVVLVGDTGVGKTGLSLVLNNQPYKETDSTAGRHIWIFGSQETKVGNNIIQTRETLLWDLAGQPGYRVIHQLHLNEVAVALVVFDARSETDPLAGVRHWERALRLAQQRQGTLGVPMKKFLVSARNDRGGVSISEERVESILKEFGFDGYFKTSAKEGWQIKELQEAIKKAIEWENLPEVSSSQLFADIKLFLLEVKKTGRLLAPANELYDEFVSKNPDATAKVTNLRDQFDTCIGRLENRDLIRRLTFGGCVLLQPELLDSYASAMVNTAKEEPDGLGSMAEEIALKGKFFVPKEQKVTDPGQEQLLLYATVVPLARHSPISAAQC